ncbi:uncharacterized protein BO96DRAFT_479439 [Aspergillus niger CBS 101883]|uniref:uncharacterized protein n=1 Tax=Aspergillus lacticoffeatus (strain CBS 101883) TaxID=1450533 RepID=UPI000D7F3F71|nr:uncharacterized protein BO96DRAFT_479439 [Aspergillus niger CBS 101883]PYH61622.1 hypothetical protein BO96DRAFT_479439 [Aspergillus niger CBS 101883]
MATPFFTNQNTDFKEYSRLLLHNTPIPLDQNPEQLASNQKHLLSIKYFQKHSSPQTISKATSATRMRTLPRQLMVRRMMASVIPIRSDCTIGQDIPPVVKTGL